MPPKRLTRAESQELTVRRLLQAAEKVFTAKGYANASVEEIALEAGYSKGAVYANFEGKEALFFAVQEQRNVAWTWDLLAAVEGGGSDAELLDRIGRWHHTYTQGDVERFKLDGEYWLLAARNADLGQRVADAFRVGTANAAALIEEEGRSRGWTAPIPAAVAAEILVAAIYGMQVQARFDPDLIGPEVFPTLVALVCGADPSLAAPSSITKAKPAKRATKRADKTSRAKR